MTELFLDVLNRSISASWLVFSSAVIEVCFKESAEMDPHFALGNGCFPAVVPTFH